MQSGPVAARHLIGDALTIRHRLPRLWARVQAGQVWAWKARQIAQRSSTIGELSCRLLDKLVTPQVELMSWARFEKILDATLLQVDQATYQRRADEAAARRDVRVFSTGDGLRTLLARLEGGDASAFMALVERVGIPSSESPPTTMIRPIRGRPMISPKRAGGPTSTPATTSRAPAIPTTS